MCIGICDTLFPTSSSIYKTVSNSGGKWTKYRKRGKHNRGANGARV